MSSIHVYGMSWQFSNRALGALERMGVSSSAGLKSFILKLLTMRVVREGETEINFFGTGLRVHQEGKQFAVVTLEEMLPALIKS